MTIHPRWPGFAVLAFTLVTVPTWQEETSGTTERLRGVAAVDRQTAWASGNRGTVLRTTDGGTHWLAVPVAGADALDFRDIEAIDADTAYVLAIGAGDKSRIYKTTDGGRHWSLSFANDNPKAFYDAIAFWNAQRGLAVGDPVDGRFTVVRTTDGGHTWHQTGAAHMPDALAGEGAFAASGTCLVVGRDRLAWFVTGGAARARVFRSTDAGETWTVADTPLAAGVASAGAFSIAFADGLHGIVVGGDYRREPEPSENAATSDDGGRTWNRAPALPGFRSAVAFVPGAGGGHALVATGPAGSDWSVDGGRTWASIPGRGFHALALAPRGGVGWAVGEGGRVAKLELPAASTNVKAAGK